jgi:hypothetical protein
MRHIQIAGRAALALMAVSLLTLLLAVPASAQTVPEIGIGVGHLSMINDDGGASVFPS